MRGGLVALVALLSSCFSPSVETCALACGPESACPPGAVCLADGFCHDGPDEPLCEMAEDAGLPDAAPADAAGADAAGPCGNGMVEEELGEACDDGDAEAGDGCDGSCAVEPDFVCVGEPSTCRRQPRDPGDVLVTEFLANPQGMGADEEGREWFELHNPTETAWDLLGVTIADADNDSFTIESSLPLPAGASLVFAGSGDPAENGGIESPDFVLAPGQFRLANDVDEVILFEADSSSQVLDRVDYNSNFPIAVGASASLDPGSYDAADNDDGANWCLGDQSFGDGSGLGTPGEVNPPCL